MKAESGKREHAFWEVLSACCILNSYSYKMGKQLKPVLGPAFFIYLGYMDPGKWATAVEGGSRFGFELLWVLVLSILFATLLQALSSRLGLVTRKNLAQGVLEPAFSSPRTVPPPCLCVQGELFDGNQEGCISHPRSSLRDSSLRDDGCCGLSNCLSNGLSMNSFHSYPHSWPRGLKTSSGRGKGASSSVFIEIIREVETAISARKGRTGTAAGDVAFPKGKENLVSVLKRYKRRLGNKHLVTAITGGSGTCGTRRSLAASTFY